MANVATDKLVAEGFGYLNAKKTEEFFSLYSEDLRSPTLANMGLPTNKDGFKAFVNMFYAAFSETQFLPQTVLTEGDTAMFRWVFKAKHTGDFNGVEPTGRQVEVDAFTTFRRGADGKVIVQHDVADLVTLLRQIGAMP
jgi:predicted ester cyclase